MGGDLDDLVHDLASNTGSVVNNLGPAGQITYLVEQLGWEQFVEAAIPEGAECPLCLLGTLTVTPDAEIVCQGECGHVWRNPQG